jgi:predicted O-linked N-acetylglucosamine transferase (SPINDLY family)
MDAYRQGRLGEAESLCRPLLQQDSAHVGGLFMLAVLRMAVGDDDTAARLFRRALVLSPAIADAYGNLAAIRQRQGAFQDAAALLDRALALSPDNAGWRASRALLRPERAAAIRDCLYALALSPSLSTAWRALGHARRQAGDPAGAATAFDRAHRTDPAFTLAQDEAFTCRLLGADWRDYDGQRQRLLARIDQGGPALPLLTQWIGASPAQQRRAAERVWKQQVQTTCPAAPGRAGKDEGRLTVAYLSADFHDHATAYLIAELFEQHDRQGFHILAGSYGRDDGSAIRGRIQGAAHGFRDLSAMGNGEVAAWAAAEQVDILVDLKGYTAGGRLDLLSPRLAPVQVAYLGYPGTMGGAALDYLIGDPVVSPADHQPFYHEKLAILPDCYQVNDRKRPLPAAAPSRAMLGLPEQGFVFGALHTPQKLNPAMFALWMRLLRAVPDSCLWLYDQHGAATGNLREAARQAGVAPDRLAFAGPAPLPLHLARYRAIDLCLDSFPYTGHTTTSDALWMGVPVVAMLGEGFAGRVSASLLRAVGLAELVTADAAGYEALALELARDGARLAGLRRHLEQVRHTAPLFDTPRFTAHLEDAYRMMWARHRTGLPPESFSVPPRA